MDEDELSHATGATGTHGASANWAKYVSQFLPLERATEFDKEELAWEELVCKAIGREVWMSIPKDIRINIMRGNSHEKERLKVTAESARMIAEWRAKYRVDADMLRLGPLPGSEVYHQAWPTRVAGIDAYGHPILYDRFSVFDAQKILTMSDDDFYRFRTQALEALEFKKRELGEQLGHRISKHVYVLDLSGLDATKHFTSAAQKKMRPVMKMSADMFPETLWCVWIINAPMSFRFIWSVVRTWLDPLIRAKIRMWGSTRAKFHAAMAECGVTLASLPVEFGGTAPSESLQEILVRAAAKHAEDDSKKD